MKEFFYKVFLAIFRNQIVEDCYLGILERNSDPDGKKATASQLPENKLSEIIQGFIRSAEFSSKIANRKEAGVVPLEYPGCLNDPKDLDTIHLDKLVEIVESTWSGLGETAPEYSVLSSNEFDPAFGLIDQEEFYRTGYAEVQQICDILKRHGFLMDSLEEVVEFGCGLGRVTIPLAKKLKKVTAYDISSPHLGVARSNLDSQKIENVELKRFSTFDQSIVSCDLFYSRIVFQHNPPPLIRFLIKRALMSLKPLGIAIFQVPTYIPDYSFDISKYLAEPNHQSMELHCISQSVIHEIIRNSGCKLLEVREDASIGNPSVYISNTFIVQKD